MRVTEATYEKAVERLVEAIYDATQISELSDIIENGLTGVRQMPNAQLEAEWKCRFGSELKLTDPKANPNGEGDPTDYAT